MTNSYETEYGTCVPTVENFRCLHVQRAAGYVYLDVLGVEASSEVDASISEHSIMLTEEQAAALRAAL